MRTSLRSIVDKMLGRIPGKASRLDTATRMTTDADFSDRRESSSVEPRRLGERDNAHLFKPVDPLADVHFLQELVRVVNEAQDRDAEDERRLYYPALRDRS
jgi:hypothetical protein